MNYEDQIIDFLSENKIELDLRIIHPVHYRLLDSMGKNMFDIFPKSGKVFVYANRKWIDYRNLGGALIGIKQHYFGNSEKTISDCIKILERNGYEVIKKAL